jgi:hypothetical protein
VPTLAPADVGAVVDAGQVRLAALGVEPLCLRWEDADGDGGLEWVGMYLRPGDPPELTGFVLDGETWHDLRPLEDEELGLGQYPTCDLTLRDINADGRVEILIRGYAEDAVELLHIFVWDGTQYWPLAWFEGPAGIRLANEDGDLADEVIVSYKAGDGLRWDAIHTWDGTHYAWTWERYGWLFLDRPHAYPTDTPENVVISFYLALDDRDLPRAFALLSSATKASQTYEQWAAGFATTVAVEVGAVHELPGTESAPTTLVAAQVRAYDNEGGRIVGKLWDVEWTLAQTVDGWRLQSASMTELEQWEANYYP